MVSSFFDAQNDAVFRRLKRSGKSFDIPRQEIRPLAFFLP